MSTQQVDGGHVRRFPVGAECAPGGVSFRVWAPDRDRVSVVVEGGSAHPLAAEGDGYFSGVLPLAAGDLYRFKLDDDATLYPDPASRHQPEGCHGPSRVVDPAAYRWRDAGWKGVRIEGQVVYEMHVGTFTPEGTWAAAARKLPLLKEIGVTLVEMMPVNEFPGRFGWGYDGVDLFAPTRLYGGPDDLRAFIDEAHALGVGVILDVVYNHLGPDGNYLGCFSKDYFNAAYENEWGDAINFDGRRAEGSRAFFLANAAYWISEFHFDGLRLDATQSLFDKTGDHIVAAIARVSRAAAGERDIVLIGENEPQHSRLALSPDEGGYGLDALWNDDLHHSATVAATGRNEAYYEDHRGEPQEFVSAAKYGYLFQGQVYAHQKQRRGEPALGMRPTAFVNFLQNHDQIANSATGARLHQLTSPARMRALTALILLLPGTPMLFQGQEFAASTPFLFFADHKPELTGPMADGRREFLSQFPSIATKEAADSLRRPDDPRTFSDCVLDWSERERNAPVVALHRDLLALRKSEAAFSGQKAKALDGAVLGAECFVLRFFGPRNDDRLLLVNLGRDLVRAAFPEPLLAPPPGFESWRQVWSSEDRVYDGAGTPPVETEQGWRIPGHAAVVLGV